MGFPFETGVEFSPLFWFANGVNSFASVNLFWIIHLVFALSQVRLSIIPSRRMKYPSACWAHGAASGYGMISEK